MTCYAFRLFGLLFILAHNPYEALDVDPVARLQLRKLILCFLDEIEQALVDSDVEAGLVIGCETVADPRRKVLGDLGLQEHVGSRAP
ncbi:MAG: hypothetical protein ACREJ5_11650 [Geminicoccaceae bacterium]